MIWGVFRRRRKRLDCFKSFCEVLEISPDAGVNEDCFDRNRVRAAWEPLRSAQARKAYRKLAARPGAKPHPSCNALGPFSARPPGAAYPRYHPDVDSSPEATARGGQEQDKPCDASLPPDCHAGHVSESCPCPCHHHWGGKLMPTAMNFAEEPGCRTRSWMKLLY